MAFSNSGYSISSEDYKNCRHGRRSVFHRNDFCKRPSRETPEGLFSPTFIKIFFLKTILNEQQLAITIQRLSHQVLENHLDLKDTVLIGIQPRGIYFSDRLIAQ